ncbi:MAG: hypothetical protein WC781_02865 [Candidatus Pacearchaeota archaeon]|jgi:hypothetical protein
MKIKYIWASVLFMFVFLAVANFVSAQPAYVPGEWDDGSGDELSTMDLSNSALGAVAGSAANGITGFLSTIQLTPRTLSSVLLGALLWIVLYSVLGQIFKVGEKRWARVFSGAVALIITLLAFIYLPANFVEAITLQYSAMGAAILTVIPFAILLYFTVWVSESLLIARVTWIFYIVYYFTLFIYKLASTPAEGGWWAQTIPYWGAIIAGILILILIPGIRTFVFRGKLTAVKEKGMNAAQRRKALLNLEKENLEAFGG